MSSLNDSVKKLNASVNNTGMINNTVTINNTGTINNRTAATEQTEMKVALVISWIELVLIVILNSLLIILLLKRRPKSRMAFFVLHLSLSDLAFGIVYLMPDVYQRSTLQWFSQSGENVSCIIYQYLSHVVVYASTYMLVVLTIDRLYVILRPLNSSKRGRWYKNGMVIAAWVISMTLALPQPIVAAKVQIVAPGGRYLCDLAYKPGTFKALITLFVCAVLVIPLCILLVCYIWIIFIIWSRQKLSGKDKGTYGNIDSSEKQISGGSNIMTRAKIRSVQMAFLVVIVYILCWSPFMFNVLLITHDVIQFGSYYYILMALAPLNSAANPLVFMVFNHNMILGTSKNEKSCPSAATATTYLLKPKKRNSQE